MKVLITQDGVISYLGSIVEVGRNFKEVNSCNDLGSPHSSVTRSQFRTFNFLIMNPAFVLQQIKKLDEDLESLKAPIDPDDDCQDQDYEF